MQENPPLPTAHWCALGQMPSGDYMAATITAGGEPQEPVVVAANNLAEFVAGLEASGAPRWVWHHTPAIYAALLASGVRVERCHDLTLCHQILRSSEFVRDRSAFQLLDWVAPEQPQGQTAVAAGPALFDMDAQPTTSRNPFEITDVLREFERQRAAVNASAHPGRLALLLAAESAGALIASELAAAGLPWDSNEHDRILTESLGPRPTTYAEKPAKLAAAGDRVRAALGDPNASLDSPPKLLTALRRAGVHASSTSQWELAEYDHPAIAPLLEYKKLSRLLTANGWAWLDEWVTDDRYRPVYLPGGVVTGRWASSGGGALQLPRSLRPALRADPGWKLVSADVSQLEPRALAAMSGDRAMANAGRGKDLYEGIVRSSAIESRDEAKIAMLGAMYGATSGESGRLLPHLRRAFPSAMRFVDRAAETGERGGAVSTWLGRSTPPVEPEWQEAQSLASQPGATQRDEQNARRAARDRGRFTRNFVVQGTAAEWALAWLAEIRRNLAALPEVPPDRAASASGPVFGRRPHLAFFLHDEIIVHSPAEHADAVAQVVLDAADAAAELLFRGGDVDFRLDLSISERATKS